MPDGTPIIDNKPAIKPISVPEGKLAAPTTSENNFHNIIHRDVIIDGRQRNIELIHQLRSGDCVPSAFVNTCSIELDGKLPMTINEVRSSAIRMRREQGEEFRDIAFANAPLSYKDTVRLFSSIHGQEPKQEDILTIEGRLSNVTRQTKAVDILEYLDTYPSGLMVTGLQEHCRAVKKLQGDNYAVIDPMNPQGLSSMNTEQMVVFLGGLMANRPPDSNFFFFVRK
jgi:hypothetical protein